MLGRKSPRSALQHVMEYDHAMPEPSISHVQTAKVGPGYGPLLGPLKPQKWGGALSQTTGTPLVAGWGSSPSTRAACWPRCAAKLHAIERVWEMPLQSPGQNSFCSAVYLGHAEGSASQDLTKEVAAFTSVARKAAPSQVVGQSSGRSTLPSLPAATLLNMGGRQAPFWRGTSVSKRVLQIRSCCWEGK